MDNKKSQNLLSDFYSSRKPQKFDEMNSQTKKIKKFIKNKQNIHSQHYQVLNISPSSQAEPITDKAKIIDKSSFTKKSKKIPDDGDENDARYSLSPSTSSGSTHFKKQDVIENFDHLNVQPNEIVDTMEEIAENRSDTETSEFNLTIEPKSENEMEDDLEYNQETFDESFRNNVENLLKQETVVVEVPNDELRYEAEDKSDEMTDNQQVSNLPENKSSEIEITYNEETSSRDSDDNFFTENPQQHEHSDSKSHPDTPSSFNSPPASQSSQERHSVILSPDEQHLSLELLGLPEHMVVYYRVKGIYSLMQWQFDALHLPGVLEGKRNLIFGAPTSAGKTIVSDILLIRSIMAKQKKGLIILPYISLANEKVVALEAMLKYSNLEVGGFMGNSLPTGRFPRVNIAVCTIEKANNIINRLIEEKKLGDLGIVVIDELHELGMSERGSILEQTLVKLKYLRSEFDIQIVGMSATLPNLEHMADWLDSACYRTDYRPIPLDERIVKDDQIMDAKTFEVLRTPDDISVKVRKDGKLNLTCSLALETMLTNNGVLVFCESKKTSEVLAQSLTKTVRDLLAYNPEEPVARYAEARDKLKDYIKVHHLDEIAVQLRKCPSKLDEILANTLPCAIAFHHAGLSMDERDILESGFKNGSIKALFATPTLSSGVNLPARRVVINKAQVGIDFLNPMVYKQMVGRAGRKNIDTSGESFIIVNPTNKDEEKIKKLVNSPLEPIKSKAIEQDKTGKIVMSESFKRLTLESIATGMLAKFEQIKSFLNMTFFAHQTRPLTDDEIHLILDQLTSTSEATIQRLVDKKDQTEHYVASKLGQGILASSFPPDEALRLKRELELAMNALCIKSNLHLLYYVIPNSNLETKWIDWQVFYDLLLRITEKNKESVSNVMNLLGVNIGFIFQQIETKNSVYTEAKGKYIKFFLTLALNEVMKERPLKEVCEMFNINRGELQSLQQRSSSYAGMLSIFCKKLGWDMLSSIIKIFQDRLYFGISQELIELMNITCLNAQMARCLYDEGFVDVKTIARSNKLEIEKVLVSKAPENPDMKTHWVSNRFKSLSDSEISELIVNEARCVIEEEAGGKIMWDDEESLEVRTADTSMGSSRFASQVDEQFDKTKVRVKYVNDNLSQIQAPTQSTFFHALESSQDSSQTSNGSTSPTKRSHSPFRRRPNRSPRSKRSNKYWDSSSRKKQRTSFENMPINGTAESDRSVIFSDESEKPRLATVQPTAKESDDQKPHQVTINSLNSNCSNATDPFEVLIEAEQLNSGILTDIGSAQLSSFAETSGCETIAQDNNFKILSQSPESSKRNMDVELFDPTDDEENQTADDDEVDYAVSSGTSVTNVKATCSKLNDKLFYNSVYNQRVDEKCFQKVDFEAFKICDEINTGSTLKFYIRTVDGDYMDTFIKRLRSAHMFLLNFKLSCMIVQEKDFLTNKWRSCQDTRVTSNWLHKIEKMCFMFGDQKIYYLKSNEVVRLFKAKLKESKFEFADQLVTGICYDAKVGYKILKRCLEMSDENLRKIYWHDPKVAHWLLNPDAEEPHGFFDIASDYFDAKNNFSLFQKISKYKRLAKLKESETKSTGKSSKDCEDFEILASILLMYPVMSTLKHKLKEKELYISYINVELPVLIVFAEMELHGFTLDREYLSTCLVTWSNLNEQLERLIHNHLVKHKLKTPRDKRLNVRAPRDVKYIFSRLGLYEKLVARKEFRLPAKVLKSLSTGKEVLDKMRTFEPFAGWISDSRKLLHLIDSRDDLIKEMEQLQIENKVIGTYKHFMATGRIAMFNPNLLGIDRDSDITIDNKTHQLSLKRVFKASTGYLLVTADYCQLELRLLAVLSKDQNLIEVFKVNKDPFKLIAARINNKDVNDVTFIERNTAKQMVYAIIYGQGLKRVAENLGVEDEEIAKEFLKEFHQAFPNLNSFIEDSKAKAREDGFIETLFGRRRYLPDINSNYREKKAGEERKAVNSRIQGSASDLVKLTMLKIDQALVKSKVDAEILLQVHDELIFQVRDNEESSRDFIRLLVREMEGCELVLKMKLPIKVRKGANWSELEDIDTSKFVN